MKIVERVFFGLALMSAVLSIVLNIRNGFTSYSWQLCTIMWIMIAWMKQIQVDKFENLK
jgi:hypothetical protein